ncbi:MAG TPA: hypothetical protein VGO86_02490 [Candidatus Dormibacteraeota bacterium]
MRRTDIESLLPANFQRAIAPREPLGALLDVMERLHAPSEAVLANLDLFFDYRRAPAPLVPHLARWMDLGPLMERLGVADGDPDRYPGGTGRLRELAGLAAWLARWRGTRRALITLLEVATGVTGFRIDERPDERPFHLWIIAPAAAEPMRDLVSGVIELEKPAFTTFELSFGNSEGGT